MKLKATFFTCTCVYELYDCNLNFTLILKVEYYNIDSM